MNIKSLLIGSAAALAAVSGAQAADAIVAAEPEAVEYVRVCDAYGTGFFYIPGTETCLQISGYVRIQADIGRDASDPSDYDVFARARVNFDARNDTELGTLRSFIQLRANTSQDNFQGSDNDGTSLTLEAAYIELGGFRIGKFYSWWDDSIKSESETINGPQTNWVSARYTYTADAFSAGIAVDELTYNSGSGAYSDANVGITGMLSAAAGGVKGTILVGYDTDYEEFAARGIFSADVGPGTLELAAVYSSGVNTYYNAAEWTVAADYAFKATDKLTITPMAQYFWDYGFINGNDAWRVGLTANYTIVKGLNLLATVGYTDPDVGTDSTSGFIRLQRDF